MKRKNNDKFMTIIDKMVEIHHKKDSDYRGDGPSLGNFSESERVGIPAWKGAFIRLQDKYARACTLIKKERHMVEDETLEDTLVDLANYVVIVLCLLKGEGD